MPGIPPWSSPLPPPSICLVFALIINHSAASERRGSSEPAAPGPPIARIAFAATARKAHAKARAATRPLVEVTYLTRGTAVLDDPALPSARRSNAAPGRARRCNFFAVLRARLQAAQFSVWYATRSSCSAFEIQGNPEVEAAAAVGAKPAVAAAGSPNRDPDLAMPLSRHHARNALHPRSLPVGSTYLSGFGLVANALRSASCSHTSESTKRLDKAWRSHTGSALKGKGNLREVMKRRLLPGSTGTHSISITIFSLGTGVCSWSLPSPCSLPSLSGCRFSPAVAVGVSLVRKW
mmetsp:Transcript_19198/g.39534  ORF Transcript_19198/g.39534 Transcript_19198/m.39534 type:complete len:293 (-) Transcript_19198:820-1698(-)